MDAIILKSFLPEIFLSVAIFFQLLFNVRLRTKLNFNFPVIDQELFTQTFFILFCLVMLLCNLKIEGSFSNFLFLNDEGSRCIKILFIFSCLLVLVVIFRSFYSQKLNFFEFFSIFLFSIFSSLLLLSSADLLSAYLAIEMQALCFYILASFRRDSAFSTEAGLKYFISGSFISCIFLLGASLIYGALGTLNFNSLALLLSFPFEQDLIHLKFFVILGCLLIIITLLFKVSAAPFHFWSPDVYEGAPLSATVIFSVLPKLVIFTFLVRWVFTLSDTFFDLQSIFVFCGILSVFIGTFFALKQKRIKRLFIYSSIAQVGFLVAAIGTNNLEGFFSLFFFLIIYTITSILLWGHFVVLYNFQNSIDNFYQKNSTPLFLSSLSNIFKNNKVWAFSFILIFFSVAGIPPLSGFLAKMFVILGLMETNQMIISILLIIISVVSVFYYIRVIKIIFFETKDLKINNSKLLQLITLDTFFDLDCFIFAVCLFFLIFFFFEPTFLLILSQYIVLSLLGI